jgi:CheY-like chemotaxis protein
MNHNCILHVEDEEADIFLLRRAFHRAGVEASIKAVTDGDMAINYLSGTGAFADRRENPLPSLVLLDLKLPKVTGFEVLAWLRRQPHLKSIVVIVFSSSADPKDVDRAYALGANSFVQKPPAVHQTVHLVQTLKAWWLEQNRFPTIHAAPQAMPHAA